MRALESELSWTFPAIKKQIDSLESANVIDVEKDAMKWSITIRPDFFEIIKSILIYSLTREIEELFITYEVVTHTYYLGKVFGYTIDMDLVVIYKNCEKPLIEKIKENISEVFRDYFMEVVSVVFMSHEEWEKRYRLADKFVLHIMRNVQDSQKHRIK